MVCIIIRHSMICLIIKEESHFNKIGARAGRTIRAKVFKYVLQPDGTSLYCDDVKNVVSVKADEAQKSVAYLPSVINLVS